jgi:hypothetical protein
MQRLAWCLTAALLACTGAAAQTPSFQGKTITMIVGFPAGGGTDVAGRFIAPYLADALPGKPSVIVQNRPGAEGVSAANFFAQQTKPDGLTVLVGSGGITNPMNYRMPEAKYNPTNFAFIGGVGRPGSAMFVNAAALPRLADKRAEPLTMGAYGSTPYPSQQITTWGIEFLGWNAKWVMGYRGLPDVSLALERGEVDMLANSSIDLYKRLTESGKFKAITQTGATLNGKLVPRTEFVGVPLFSQMMEGKIKDPVQQKGFDYWFAQQNLSTWMALPPDTPQAIVELYRKAYENLGNDPDFMEKAKKIAEDFTIQPGADVADAVKTLDNAPREALDYISDMLRRQGAGPGR